MFGILNFFGWFILPNLLTGFAQTLWYRIMTPAGEPKPLRNSARFRRDRRRIYSAIICAYLLFSVVEAYYSVVLDPKSPDSREASIYRVLEISVDDAAGLSGQDLRSTFRKLSLKYHPDKVAAAAAAASAHNGRATAGTRIQGLFSRRKNKAEDYLTWSSDQIEARFIQIKAAYEMLNNQVTKFGYERFGPQAVAWSKRFDALMDNVAKDRDGSLTAQTMLEFLVLGLKSSMMTFYLGTFGSIAVMYTIGYPKTGHAWRVFIGMFCMVLEIFIVTRPLSTVYSYLPIMRWFGLLPYQAIAILHNLMVTSFVAINQLGPIISESGSEDGGSSGDEKKNNSTVAAAIAGVPGTGIAGGGVIPPLASTRGQNVLQKQLEFLEQLTDNVVHESVQSYRHQLLPFVGKEKEPLLKQVKQATVDALVNRRVMDDVEVKEAVSEEMPMVRAAVQAERSSVSSSGSSNSSSQSNSHPGPARKVGNRRR